LKFAAFSWLVVSIAVLTFSGIPEFKPKTPFFLLTNDLTLPVLATRQLFYAVFLVIILLMMSLEPDTAVKYTDFVFTPRIKLTAADSFLSRQLLLVAELKN